MKRCSSVVDTWIWKRKNESLLLCLSIVRLYSTLLPRTAGRQFRRYIIMLLICGGGFSLIKKNQTCPTPFTRMSLLTLKLLLKVFRLRNLVRFKLSRDLNCQSQLFNRLRWEPILFSSNILQLFKTTALI